MPTILQFDSGPPPPPHLSMDRSKVILNIMIMTRFLEMHMYVTSALQRTDMKSVFLQMAMDLLHKKVPCQYIFSRLTFFKDLIFQEEHFFIFEI